MGFNIKKEKDYKMNKKIIILAILIACVMINFSYSDEPEYEIIGDSIIFENDYVQMVVTPHTATSPISKFDQIFNVTSKVGQEGDLCVAYVFDNPLEKGEIWLEMNGTIEKTDLNSSCSESEEIINGTLQNITTCSENPYNYSEPYFYWTNVTSQFSETTYNDKHIYYHGIPLTFDAYENHRWNIKYTPDGAESDKKWDLYSWNSISGNCVYSLIHADDRNFILTGDPWWDSDFGYKMKLTLSESNHNTTNYPLKVLFNSTNINYDHTKDDGGDLRFLNSSETVELQYYIERWNESGTSIVYVNTTNNVSIDPYIYVYYNKSTATSNSNFKDTFGWGISDYWTFNDLSNPGNVSPQYNTKGLNFTVGNITRDIRPFFNRTTSDSLYEMRDGEFNYNGNEWMNRTINESTAVWKNPKNYTLFFRFKPESAKDGKLFYSHHGVSQRVGQITWISDETIQIILFDQGTPYTTTQTSPIGAISDFTFRSSLGGQNPSQYEIFLNAKRDGNSTTGNAESHTLGNALCIGSSGEPCDGSNGFNGTIDELLIYKDTMKSSDWIAQMHRHQNITFGIEEYPNPVNISFNATSPSIVYNFHQFKLNLKANDMDGGSLIGFVQFYLNSTTLGDMQREDMVNNTETEIGNFSGWFNSRDNLTAEFWVMSNLSGDERNTSKYNLTSVVHRSVISNFTAINNNGTTVSPGNKTKIIAEIWTNASNTIQSINFTILSPNGSNIKFLENGTLDTKQDSGKQNMSSRWFHADWHGNWTWNFTSYTSTEHDNYTGNGTFEILDTIEPNITVVNPTGEYTGSTPIAIPISLIVIDQTRPNCTYDVPLQSVDNTTLNVAGNFTANYTASQTFSANLYGTYSMNFYCNDTNANLNSTSASFSTATTPSPGSPGGGGGTSTLELPGLVCEVGSDLYWTAETKRGGGGTLKFITPDGQSEETLFFKNLGKTNVTLSLICSRDVGEIERLGFDPCTKVTIEKEEIKLDAGKTETSKITFKLNNEISAGNVLNPESIFFSIRISDDLGENGCSGTILFEHQVDVFLGAWNKLNLIGGLIGGLLIVFIPIISTKVFKINPTLAVFLGILVGVGGTYTYLLFI